MNREFSTYRIELKEKPFSINEHTFPQSVDFTLLSEDEEEIEKIELAYVPASFLYSKIKEGADIFLKNAYIEGFSLSEYRRQEELIPAHKVKLKSWHTSNCLFSHTEAIDFSHAIFQSFADFNHSFFLSGLNIEFALFKVQNPNFEYTYFRHGNINFSEIKLPEGDLSFKNAIFNRGTKDFQNTNFNHGSLIFQNTQFGDGDVLFSGAKFGTGRKTFKVAVFGEGRKDFNFVHFGDGDVIFERVNFGQGNVNFRSTEFGNGKKEFLNASFGKGQKNFIHTLFNHGAISFKNVDFGDGKISFKLAELGNSKKDFHFAHFGKGDIIFDRTNFGDESLDFRAVDFGSGRFSFNRCRFGNGDLTLEASELHGSTCTISNCFFGQGAFNCENLNFADSNLIVIDTEIQSSKISFKHAKINELSFSACQLYSYYDFRMEQCKQLDLSDTIVKGVLDIKPHDFDADIQNINLSGMRLLGRIYLDWHKSRVKEFIYKQESNYRTKAEQFRILKENYNAIGEYNAEDLAYVEFKRTEALAMLETKQNDASIYKRIKAKASYYAGIILFDKVGKYATDPIRVMVSMGVVYLLFTALYLVLPLFTDTGIVSSLFKEGDPRNLSIIQRCFYHSAITFLTIGYGDYYPAGLSRWISAIEGFVGLFLMSYFTVAFVRKILR